MRHTTAILLTAACLALAGCSSSSDDSKPAAKSASPSPSASVDPVVPFMKSVEDAHLASYETGIPPYQELELFPPKWCQALDQGHSVAWMFGMTQGGLYPIGPDWGTKKADANEVLVLGVKAYCPEHLAAVTAELKATGEY